MTRVVRPVFVLLILLVASCRSSQTSKDSNESSKAPPALPALARPGAAPARASRPVLAELERCEVRHRGLFIDLGSSSADAHRAFHPGPFDRSEIKERAGQPSTFLTQRGRQYDFWLDSRAEKLQVSLRAKGEAASKVYVTVDSIRLGARRLSRDEASLVTFGPLPTALEPGRHTVQVQFTGRRKPDQAYAALDWLRVHLPEREDGHYVPPTARNLVQDIALNNEPLRALVLRAPASLRCGFVARSGARLKLQVGYQGEGEGVARVSVRLGGGQSVVLAEHKVDARKGTAWLPLDLALDAFEGRVMALEFAALGSSPTGRVVFGEPTLVQTAPQLPSPRPRNVVVVVNAGLARSVVPPWGNRAGLTNLFQLSQNSVAFDRYRVPTTLVTGVVATLLTAYRPTQSGLIDFGSGLPRAIPLVTEALRGRDARSAFFSNVPYTFPAFGLTRGFNDVDTISPTVDRPGTAPLLRAKQWLEAELAKDPEQRRLVVVHSTGGHPPWDVTRDEAGRLAPRDYNGIIEPRRAAISLREVRSRRRRASRKLGPNDWRRMVALQEVALSKQDRALGALIETLREAGQWDETLFIWMGDVAMGDAPAVPFDPSPDLNDSHLLVPLLVKFGPEFNPGQRFSGAVTTADIARTVYTALGLEIPDAGAGPTLTARLRGADAPTDSGVLSVLGNQYAYHLGSYRLSGTLGAVPHLCDTAVDPACQTDLYGEDPFLSKWLWRLALAEFAQEFAGTTNPPEPLPVELDRATSAALAVFGL